MKALNKYGLIGSAVLVLFILIFGAVKLRDNKRKTGRYLEHWHVISIMLAIYDAVVVNGAYLLLLWLRFDCVYSKIPRYYIEACLNFVPIYTLACFLIFRYCKLYNSIWRFASFNELVYIFIASISASVFHTVGITVMFRVMPVSYYILGAFIQLVLLVAVRFSYRFILLERSKAKVSNKQNVMIIGAGNAGQTILREIIRAKENADMRVCCFIDDNKNKWGRYVEGVPVAGGRDDIMASTEKYGIKKILFAIPTATAEQKRDILDICKETGCELQTLPGIYQLVNGEASLSKMKDVDVNDLLGRAPIRVNMEDVFRFVSGKVILVTGGGGSIGSELCRQIAEHKPRKLIIFDVYENNAYDIQQELLSKHPELDLTVLIGSVRDSRRINSVFEQYKPEIVYHAAAHKHVPLMETSPCEAIKNNVVGTYKTAYAALVNGCRRFVLISTDKAVNPTNIMGASKRLCEMVIQSMDVISHSRRYELLPLLNGHAAADDLSEKIYADRDNAKRNPTATEFVAVRFGNVLGSNGSVIPLFKKQIEMGGPVTVTHPDIIRYFMTIPEAVSLVLQAGTYAKGGEIFVLDMGEPVKIDTLARNLIKLSGHVPDKDIKIAYSGLRPGEKLYEEKLMAEEGLEKTENELIHIGKPIPFDIEKFMSDLESIARASYDNSDEMVSMVERVVPTFRHSVCAEDHKIFPEKAPLRVGGGVSGNASS